VVCSADAPIIGNNGSIWLDHGARLELNGHTIHLAGSSQLAPIYCNRKCTIVGPGRLTTDAVGGGVFSIERARIVVQQGRPHQPHLDRTRHRHLVEPGGADRLDRHRLDVPGRAGHPLGPPAAPDEHGLWRQRAAGRHLAGAAGAGGVCSAD
jgi:hypothetical protein